MGPDSAWPGSLSEVIGEERLCEGKARRLLSTSTGDMGY